jgi:hypothetical protein
MSDDDLRRNKEIQAECALAEQLAGEHQEPTALACGQCGSQLVLSPALTDHYGVDTTICNMCGCHWSEGKLLNDI